MARGNFLGRGMLLNFINLVQYQNMKVLKIQTHITKMNFRLLVQYYEIRISSVRAIPLQKKASVIIRSKIMRTNT